MLSVCWGLTCTALKSFALIDVLARNSRMRPEVARMQCFWQLLPPFNLYGKRSFRFSGNSSGKHYTSYIICVPVIRFHGFYCLQFVSSCLCLVLEIIKKIFGLVFNDKRSKQVSVKLFRQKFILMCLLLQTQSPRFSCHFKYTTNCKQLCLINLSVLCCHPFIHVQSLFNFLTFLVFMLPFAAIVSCDYTHIKPSLPNALSVWGNGGGQNIPVLCAVKKAFQSLSESNFKLQQHMFYKAWQPFLQYSPRTNPQPHVCMI